MTHIVSSRSIKISSALFHSYWTATFLTCTYMFMYFLKAIIAVLQFKFTTRSMRDGEIGISFIQNYDDGFSMIHGSKLSFLCL